MFCSIESVSYLYLLLLILVSPSKAFRFFKLQHWRKQYLEVKSFTCHTIGVYEQCTQIRAVGIDTNMLVLPLKCCMVMTVDLDE